MPTLWLSTHGWAPDGLDHVVSVVVGREPEQIECAARATRPAHLDAHGDKAEKWGDHGSDDGGKSPGAADPSSTPCPPIALIRLCGAATAYPEYSITVGKGPSARVFPGGRRTVAAT